GGGRCGGGRGGGGRAGGDGRHREEAAPCAGVLAQPDVTVWPFSDANGSRSTRRSGGVEVTAEERDRPRPRIGSRARSVGIGTRVVEERMPGARVGADLEVLAGRRQDVAQRLDVGQRDQAVLLAEEP